MIGVFDSGHGGLVIYQQLVRDFPDRSFAYFGDHAHAPYGNQSSELIVDLTRDGITFLFKKGCKLVLLACNTATAIAAHKLQHEWLPQSAYRNNRILGIIAPTVEAATLTPWGVTTAQYPQSRNRNKIVVFGTPRTIDTGVYQAEIRKRCPLITLVEQACPNLAGMIESRAPDDLIAAEVATACKTALSRMQGDVPDMAILGCTHYPLIEPMFRANLPPSTRILSQGLAVSDSLADYLHRHPEFDVPVSPPIRQLFTSGDPTRVSTIASFFLNDSIAFKEAA